MIKDTDIAIGDEVYIRWTYFEEEIIGLILIHTAPKTESNIENNVMYCYSSYWTKKCRYTENKTVWEFNNDFIKPTLKPSLLCHCGFHGYIEEGKWRQA